MRIDLIQYLVAGALFASITDSVCVADAYDAIAACATTDTKDARIDCLERALREMSQSGGAGVPAAPVEAQTSVRPVNDDFPPLDAEQKPSSIVVKPVENTPPLPAVKTGVEWNGSSDSTTVELGREQVEVRSGTRSDEKSIVLATVVDFDFTGYRRLLVELDNGQIWQQIDGDRVSVERGLRNEKTFEVEMWGTGLGGYRMRITPLDRTIRVERLK